MDQKVSKEVAFPRSGGGRQIDEAEIVIIGNGIAGLTAAIEARHKAPDKRIVIVTDQLHPTINTPALKQFAIAKLEREQLLAYPTGTERAERIHMVNAHVEEIHAQSKYLTLSGNRHFGYGSLLIATGSRPMGLPENVPGRNFDGVMTLHRLQDYLDLRRRIPEVREAVVIGGGVHANETVMGLLYWGIRVHWLIRGKTFMGKMFDTTASDMVLAKVRKAGAITHMETEVTGIVGRMGTVVGVITNHNEMIPCQLVLTCTGTAPVLTLAQRCSVPMQHKNGILVDDKLRTSVRDIYAAGDVAALLNPQTGSYETRPVWFWAVNQGRVAGALLAGEKDSTTRPFGVQWHATHISGLSMLTVGEPLSKAKDVMTLTDNSASGYRRIAILGDRLVGYLSLGNEPADSLAIKQIIDEGHSIRAVARDLLKGTFDARAYLASLGERAARGYLSNPRRLLAASTTTRESDSAERRSRDSSQLALPKTRQTDPLRPVASMPEAAPRPAAEQPIIFAEEPSPFTGNLPDISNTGLARETSATGGRAQRRDNASVSLHPAIFEEEPSAFTGNLPGLAAPVVEAAPARAPQPARPTRSLWEYSYTPSEKRR